MALADATAAILVVLGLAGVILPILPGALLIFLGAVVYDGARSWEAFGPLWLGLLFVLMIVAEGGDWLISNSGARKGGASNWALVVGSVLGFVGLLFFPPFGFLLGSIGGVVGVELLRAREAGQALRAGSGWLIGWLLSLIVQGVVAVLMVALILWRTGL